MELELGLELELELGLELGLEWNWNGIGPGLGLELNLIGMELGLELTGFEWNGDVIRARLAFECSRASSALVSKEGKAAALEKWSGTTASSSAR